MTVFRAAHSLKKAVHYSLLLPKTPLLTTRRHAIAYTDGSCLYRGLKNPKAGFGVFWYPGCQDNCCGEVTRIQDNNRAELCAACRAIRMAYNFEETEITIKTDSKFVIRALETPQDGRGKFLNTRCGDFMEFIDSLENKIKVTGEHVKGHSKDFGNEEAHKLAQEGAKLWGENEILTPDSSLSNKNVTGSINQ